MSVSPGEKLTRFIRYSNQFSSVNNVVRYRAFIPPRNSTNTKLTPFVARGPCASQC